MSCDKNFVSNDTIVSDIVSFSDLSTISSLHVAIIELFGSTSEEIRSAASYSLGNYDIIIHLLTCCLQVVCVLVISSNICHSYYQRYRGTQRDNIYCYTLLKKSSVTQLTTN